MDQGDKDIKKNYCYLLKSADDKRTYVGATVDPDRRLKQHNGELTGGAKATGIKVAQGISWDRICYIENLPTWQAALQVEWRWKQLGRTQYKHIKNPMLRRLWSLKKLLSLDKPTQKALEYKEYQIPLQIKWDLPQYELEYNNIKLE